MSKISHYHTSRSPERFRRSSYSIDRRRSRSRSRTQHRDRDRSRDRRSRDTTSRHKESSTDRTDVHERKLHHGRRAHPHKNQEDEFMEARRQERELIGVQECPHIWGKSPERPDE